MNYSDIKRVSFFYKYIMEWPVYLVLFILLSTPGSAQVVQDDPAALRGIDVVEHLGESIPLDLAFTSDNGDEIRLGRYFNDDKPVILILGYYTCPMLCNLVFNGVADAVKQSDWTLGKEFRIITVSIDSSETDLVASAKKRNYLRDIGRYENEDGWLFLTGGAEQSSRLAEAVGFKYFYDEENDQYAHPALLTILSPEGKISRYFYGIEFKERDLRLALMEASEGKVGSTLDRLILYCYHYDSEAGGYVAVAGNIMKLGGLFTLIIFGLFLSIFWLREIRKRGRLSQIGKIGTVKDG